jgi:mannitol/fructose-specific phosphotransferase system IIA component (Ntr-type)
MAVVLADLLDEKQIELELRTRTRDDALCEIVDLLRANGKISDGKKFLDTVIAREQAASTVAEHGIAFPHARTDLVKKIVLGIGRSKEGVRFEKSEEPIHLIFVIGVPKQMIQDYLVCVGAIARLAKDDSIRAALLEAKTKAEFIERLRSASLLLE